MTRFSHAKLWIENALLCNGNPLVLTNKQKTLLKQMTNHSDIQTCKPRRNGNTTLLLAYALFVACVEAKRVMYVVTHSKKNLEPELSRMYPGLTKIEFDRIDFVNHFAIHCVGKRYSVMILDAVDAISDAHAEIGLYEHDECQRVNIMTEYPEKLRTKI